MPISIPGGILAATSVVLGVTTARSVHGSGGLIGWTLSVLHVIDRWFIQSPKSNWHKKCVLKVHALFQTVSKDDLPDGFV